MTSTANLWHCVSPLRLAGPVFDKELRVASRRPRSYGLRVGYVMLLAVLIVSAWYQFVGARQMNPAFYASGLSDMAVHLTSQVIWFQFVAVQLIVAAMLSVSVGSEMRNGTLSVLMTTPTTSLHIMMGKLSSGLLQISQLLAVSLPVLAVVRVLGGVPWESVFACFCITLTAAAFAGTLSLLLSTYWQHPYDAISAGAVIYLFVWVVLPAVASTLASTGQLSQPMTRSLLDLTSPFRALYVSSPFAWHLRSSGQGYFFWWPAHCVVMAGLATTMLCAATWRVRRAVFASPFSGSNSLEPTGFKDGGSRAGGRAALSSRWLWKKGNLAIGSAALAVCVLMVMADTRRLQGVEVYAYYFAWGLWMVALLRLAVSVAGGIAGEKESGAWPVLLTTPLDNDQILRGKAAACLRRNAILLISAQAVQMCFVLCVNSSSKALSMGLCLFSAVASVFFITAAGLYFGVRLRSTTTAVAATLGAYLCLNYIVCGRYNPLFGWMIWKLLSISGPRSASHLMLLGFGMGSAAFVLDTAVGILLVRQAVRTVRSRVF